MIEQIKSVFDDNRGVSPVIGVILMVAITVILAAVIGTFVLNLGGNLQATPQAQLSIADASGDYGPTDGNNPQDAFTISQNGGDSLKIGDLRIVLTDTDGSNSATFESGSWSASSAGKTVQVQKSDTLVTDSDNLAVGEELTITQSTDDNVDTDQVLATGEYEVNIIHKPSDTILVKTTVTLR